MPENARIDISGILHDHATIVVPLVVGILTAIRLLAVAYGDPTTALAILQHAGTGNVLVGLVVDLSAPLLLLLIVPALMTLPPDARFGDIPGPLWVGFIVALSLIPVGVLGAAGLAMAALAASRFRRNLKRLPIGVLRRLLPSVAILYAFVPIPWIPAERIVYDGGERTGYVLSTSPEQLVVLTTGRQVVMVQDPGVRSRTICQPRRAGRRRLLNTPSALGLVISKGDPPVYPLCRDLRPRPTPVSLPMSMQITN